MSKGVTPQSENYAKWYTDVVQKAELADYSPVKGCMVIRPYGYALWENIKAELDKMFKETGHVNAYFPLLIPEGFLKKEAEHIKGFAPELAIVTHAGGKKLEEPLVIRPTSETIIWSMYKKWINSYRDLPLLINQWANVVRWEMRTRMFLRTTEFLWQEGHTAHASAEEAMEESLKMVHVYQNFAEQYMAMPVIVGKKTENEKFAGAIDTFSIEAMMGDKRALQSGTSHYLGQNFAKAFDVTFQNERNEKEYVYASSWGISTRLIGALIMTHGDDKGLILPPRIAPYQVVIIPIYRDSEAKSTVMTYIETITNELKAKSVRFHLDTRETLSPGYKFNDWEMKGVPLRLEIGPRDVKKGNVVVFRRDNAEKIIETKDAFCASITRLLETIQESMFENRKAFRKENTRNISNYDELKTATGSGGFARAFWAGTDEEEKQIQEETKVTIRCIPLEQSGKSGICFYTGKQTTKQVVLAKAY